MVAYIAHSSFLSFFRKVCFVTKMENVKSLGLCFLVYTILASTIYFSDRKTSSIIVLYKISR
jgi:hypothetical protein